MIPWVEATITGTTKYIRSSLGVAWYDPGQVGFKNSLGLYISVKCNIASVGVNIFIFTGSELQCYNSAGTLLSTLECDILNVYPDMGYTVDGRIVALINGELSFCGSYEGLPVANSLTIHNGKLLKYKLIDGRYSVTGKFNTPMPVGNIVFSGFNYPQFKFAIVSEYRSIVYQYSLSEYDYTFSVVESKSHDKAIGIAGGKVITYDGGPGKLTDVFDFSSVIGVMVNRFVGERSGDTYYSTPFSYFRDEVSPGAGYTTYVVNAYCACEVQPYSDGTLVSGSVYKNGQPGTSTWDTYYIDHIRGSTTVDRYWLNYNPSTIGRLPAITNEFEISLLQGDILRFGFDSVDGISTSTADDASDEIFNFNPIPTSQSQPSYEAGVRVSVFRKFTS